jgi:hypothetical protein
MSDARDIVEFISRATNARIDFIKHLTTLATGAILILAAFLERLFAQPEWKFLVGIALFGFLASIIFAVPAHTAQVNILYRPLDVSRRELHQTWIVALAQYLTFLVGMVALTAFALRNLF